MFNQVASRGGFLSTPCEVSFNPKTKKYECKPPPWFSGMGYYTLATYIAHKFETAIWVRYVVANSPPRKGGVDQGGKIESRLHLQGFWGGLSKKVSVIIVVVIVVAIVVIVIGIDFPFSGETSVGAFQVKDAFWVLGWA